MKTITVRVAFMLECTWAQKVSHIDRSIRLYDFHRRLKGTAPLEVIWILRDALFYRLAK
jgi:hypothetical protein